MALLPESGRGFVLLMNANHHLMVPAYIEVGMEVAALLAGVKPEASPLHMAAIIPWALRSLLLLPALLIGGVVRALWESSRKTDFQEGTLPGSGRRHWRPVGDQAAAGQTTICPTIPGRRWFVRAWRSYGAACASAVDAAIWAVGCFHATGGCALMNKNTASYQVVELSPARRVLLSLLDLPRPKHCMYGLLEVDVTPVKQWIEECKAHTGEQLSFTGYLVFCLARAVEEDKMVQGYLRGRRQMVVYDDGDVGLMVEKKIGEKHTLAGHVIYAANRKSWREIHAEIRAAQSSPAPAGSAGASWFYSALLLPWPLPNLALGLMAAAARRNPALFASLAGTVGVTAVGMFGEGQGGWGIAPIQHSLGLIVGSTAWKPAIVQGLVEPRELLNLTVTFDHAVVDGAPAARFTRRLVELIESGYGLGVRGEEEHVRATSTCARWESPTNFAGC